MSLALTEELEAGSRLRALTGSEKQMSSSREDLGLTQPFLQEPTICQSPREGGYSTLCTQAAFTQRAAWRLCVSRRCAAQVCGSRCTVAIDIDGQVLAWGWNARATLGHGHRCRITPLP